MRQDFITVMYTSIVQVKVKVHFIITKC